MPFKEYYFRSIILMWNIRQTEDFEDWFSEGDEKLQEDIVTHVEILKEIGPLLGRPYADTLKGSSIKNLKELRFRSGSKVIRIFFIFDSERNGVLLIGGDKAGSGDKIFYDQMIAKSEKIYFRYLQQRRKNEKKKI
jgi:hypothetical protein